MAEAYDVHVRVISQQGTCAAGHKVGDEWTIATKTPAGVCLSAFHAILPSVRVLRFGGAFPYSNDPDTAEVACPDAKNPLIFELRRVKK
ncbi:MAG: hypothetical protein HW402_743 [Dehalococcoidales bacterium]|nr:hypothetical protein [Dehalococcoidales bacterium]